jgi:hypothetical protein
MTENELIIYQRGVMNNYRMEQDVLEKAHNNLIASHLYPLSDDAEANLLKNLINKYMLATKREDYSSIQEECLCVLNNVVLSGPGKVVA